jgi:outer membrane usher protein
LVDAAGDDIPVGSTATVAATGTVAPVGYDGEVFFENLAAVNELAVETPTGARCGVAFEYVPSPGDIPKIGPLTCR